MTTKRQRVYDMIVQTYDRQRQQMAEILNELITEDSLQTQNGEKVTMESRFTDLENHVKSLTSELGQTKKDDSTELDTKMKTDAEKMQMQIAELQKQLEEQKEMQLAGQNMQATIAQLQTEVQAQRQLNKDLLQEMQKMQMCNVSLQQELDTQKKMQVDIKQLQTALEDMKTVQPDLEKLQKQITEQIMKEIQQTKVPSPPRAAPPPPSSRRVSTTEYLQTFQRIQAAEKEVQDLKEEVRCLKLEKMTAKEREDLAGKLDRRTFEDFTVEISQTMKQLIGEGLKCQEEKWTAMMEKNNQTMEKKLDKMEEYIIATEKRLRKTIEDLMVPPPKEFDEAAISTSKCLTCSRSVETTTIKNMLPRLPALPSPHSLLKKQPIVAGKPARYNETIFPTKPQKRFGAVIKGTPIPPIRTGTPTPPIRKALLPEVLKARHKGKQ